MAVYQFHESGPVLKYFLVSVGSSLLLVVSLLLCGKKEKKNEKSTVPAEGKYTPTTAVAVEEVVVKEVCDENIVECAPPAPPMENDIGGKRRDTDPIQPPKEPLRKVLSAVTPRSKNGDVVTPKRYSDIPTDADNSGNGTTVHPYDTVSKKPPVFEYSGNSENSGNSIYAKVKDVPRREETAYAVVDIGQDKDYDFVNGEVVRRTPDSTNANNPPLFMHYDKPKSPELKITDETENSGASGIYEFVPESKTNKENLEPLSIDVQQYNNSNSNNNNNNNSNDLYDFCGPATPRSQTADSSMRSNSSCDVIDRTTTPVSETHNSLDRKTNLKQREHSRRSSSKEALDKSGEFKEESRLSRYLKFTQSKKQKKHSDETVDVPSPYSSSKDVSVTVGSSNSAGNTLEVGGGGAGDDKAPPAPSIQKLKQLASRNEHHGTFSEKSYSPDSSVSGSSPSELNSNQALFSYEEPITNLDACTANTSNIPYGRHTSRHRPRVSDGSIQSRDLPPTNEQSAYKTQYSDPTPIPSTKSGLGTSPGTQSVSETTVNKNTVANQIHVVLEKTSQGPTVMTSRGSLISEPDYAEIESRGNTRPQSLGTVPSVVSNEDGDATATNAGYTEINFGSPNRSTENEDNFKSSSGYAVVDFSKKNEDRRIRDLYAAVDFKAKRSRSDEGDSPVAEGDFEIAEFENEVSVNAKYEGPYDIIPEPRPSESVSVTVQEENIYDVFN